MTDKIIIDGVDVSKCNHYKNKTCLAYYLFSDMAFNEAKCELSPNCNYKQLKRKEQECESNQLALNKANEIIAELEHKLQALIEDEEENE